MVIPVRIHGFERDLFFELQFLENFVYGLAFSAVPHVMQLGIEFSRLSHLESMSISAGVFMRLQHHDFFARSRHQGREYQAGDATPHNQEIRAIIYFVHTSRTIPRTKLKLQFINAPAHMDTLI